MEQNLSEQLYFVDPTESCLNLKMVRVKQDCSVSLQPPNPVSVKRIKQTIILYRFNHAKHFSDPNAVLLAGLEIDTGISE